MKNRKLHLMLVLLIFANNLFAEGIKFTDKTKWADILLLAKKENKLIFLDAYASWCGPCKYLQNNVFTESGVGDFYNKQFINVKMDMENGEGPGLSEQLGLTAYPTLFFINSDGEVLHKSIGSMEASDLLELGVDALDPLKQFYTIKKCIATGNLPVTNFQQWVINAIKLNDSFVDSAISIYLIAAKPELYNREMLQILVEHAGSLEEKLMDELYVNRKRIQQIIYITAEKFDEMMMPKILVLAADKSREPVPSFDLYYKVVAKYQPTKAKLETQRFKIYLYKELKEDKQMLVELMKTISDKKIGLPAYEMAYMVLTHSKTIVQEKMHTQFIKVINGYVVSSADKKITYAKNLALFGLYDAMKNKNMVLVYRKKLSADPNVPENILAWVMEHNN